MSKRKQLDRLHDALLHACRRNDVAKQRQLMIRIKEASMAVRSMDIGEPHRLDANSKGGQRMLRYKNPKGPRFQDVVKAYMR